MKQKQTNTAHTNNTTKKITNWKEYNASLENRGNFSILLNVAYLNRHPKQTGKSGHPFEYSDAMILFLAQLRELTHLPIRQTRGMAKAIFKLAWLNIRLPQRSTISRRMGDLKVPTNLDKIKYDSPIILLPDSTGLKVSGEGEWKVRKHGADKRRKWIKVHLSVDYNTGAIVASSVTEASADDGHELPTLLDQVEQNRKLVEHLPHICETIADGAYDQHHLYLEAEERHMKLLVPPPRNAVWHGDIKDGTLVDEKGWETRNSYVRGIVRLGRAQWKHESGYHKRSLAETAMSRFKTAFNGSLKSKKAKNQVAEVKIRVSLLNLFTGYGRPRYTT